MINDLWNTFIIKQLKITPITNLRNDDYVKLYEDNKIILVPSYLQYNTETNKKEAKYFCKYKGLKYTNWQLISLLNKPLNFVDIRDEDDDAGKPNNDYYKYHTQNNSIEAYTGSQSNLITIDIDHAFLCHELFMKCYQSSTLCTLTKNGFHFHFKYNDRLRKSRVFKDDLGFDIKNNTVIRMPPSYYDKDGQRFTYYFFKFGEPSVMPDDLINYINNLTDSNGYIPLSKDNFKSIESYCDSTRNKVFKDLIDKIPVVKADNVDTWKRFGRICAFLNYPIEFYDYFSKKSDKYNFENNIDTYNSIYRKAHDDLILIKKLQANQSNKKKDELKPNEKELLAEYDSCKSIIDSWIKEDDSTYFDAIEEIAKHFIPGPAAEYFHKQNPGKYLYDDKDWYILLPNNRWKKTTIGFINHISRFFEEEFYKLDDAKSNKAIKHLTGSNIDQVLRFLKLPYYNNEFEFDAKPNLIGFKDKVFDLETKELRDYRPDDYITMSTRYNLEERDQVKINKLYDLIKTIQPDEEHRKCLLSVYARCLYGKNLEKFIILNGDGGNGKGLLYEFLMKVFGDYGYQLNMQTLCVWN